MCAQTRTCMHARTHTHFCLAQLQIRELDLDCFLAPKLQGLKPCSIFFPRGQAEPHWVLLFWKGRQQGCQETGELARGKAGVRREEVLYSLKCWSHWEEALTTVSRLQCKNPTLKNSLPLTCPIPQGCLPSQS